MIKLLKKLSAKEWGLVGLSLLFIVAQVWLDLKLPEYMSTITRLVQTQGSAMSDILLAGGKMLLCALGSLCCTFIVAVFSARIGSNFSARLRSLLFNKVDSFSLEEINGFSTASLITRSTNDVTQVQMLIVMGLQMLIKAPIMAAWAILKISGKTSEWTLATGISVLILLVVVGVCISIALPRFKKMQRLTDEINRTTRENLNGLRIVRAYNAENYQEAKFEKANEELTHNNLTANITMSVMMPSISAIMNGLSLAIYWIGAILISQAALPNRLPLFSDMVVFSSYAAQVIMSFMMLVMVFILLPRASVSAKRICEVLETQSKLREGTIETPTTGKHGDVEFRHVSFKYPDAEDYVLKDVSFTAHKGETVAFIGSTGSGKSTVVNLIPRFYDATEGEVLVDGVNVKDYKLKALCDRLGYVSQKAVLFGGTIVSNILYGDNGRAKPALSDAVDAAYTAQASEFIENMDQGYDSYVAQGGTNLSGGQKQRVSIARAVCRDPEIFIFDDSFSALDYKTDHAVRAALKKNAAGATTLIVAQRIGTIREADRIVVLEDGRVAGMGTHDELMRSCKVYQEIAYSQLSKEELA